MTVKQIYLLFTDTGTVLTKTIKLYTRKSYNHASISFDEELTQLYSFGRKHPRNPFIGGFVKENINEGLLKNATCAVYCLKVEEADYGRMWQYISKIEAQKEYYHYNLIGLFAVILNMQLERDNAFFCSEFVASVLKQSEAIDFNMPLSLITPHDLQKMDNLELAYQGKLKDYQKNTKNQHYPGRIETSAELISI